MKEKLKPYILLSPLLIILVLIFISGIVMAFMQSLGYFPAVGLEELTLKYYKEILTNNSFLDALKFSLYTSFVSSIISVIFGVLLAFSIYRIKGKKNHIESLYRVPVIVPHLISVLLVYTMLSQTGVLARILYGLGLIGDQAQFSLLYNRNGIGIIVAYVWKEIPFIALTTYAVLNRMSTKLYDAAKNLGANGVQAFFHIILPLILPTILSSFIIVFAFSFGAYEVPLLLGPTYPKALPVQAYIEYSNPMFENRPYAMSMNIIIATISLFFAWLYVKLFERIHQYEK